MRVGTGQPSKTQHGSLEAGTSGPPWSFQPLQSGCWDGEGDSDIGQRCCLGAADIRSLCKHGKITRKAGTLSTSHPE